MRNALLTLCAYLALLCLAPPPASAQKGAHAAPPLVPMAQLQALAVALSGHDDTTLECDGPLTFARLLEAGGITVAKGTEVDGFVNRLPDGSSFIDVIHMPSALCRSMQMVRRDDVDAGKAFESLAHEATHLRLQSTDESLVECTAYENRWQAVAPLHLAAWLARDVLAEMVYDHQSTLPNYRQVC